MTSLHCILTTLLLLFSNLAVAEAEVAASAPVAAAPVKTETTQLQKAELKNPEAQAEKLKTSCVLEMVIDGAIGPATLDFIERGVHRAKQNNCGAMMLLVNTPGGNLQTTRMIVEQILNSKTPFLCLVHPSGGHAGSAGAIILQACHVAGAITATNIGAATPVSGGGEKIPDDLRKKLLNDTRSWVEGLAKLRGRSEQFARDIVEDATALSAEDALKAKAIDFVGSTRAEFLKFAEGRKVIVADNQEITLALGEVTPFQQDLRYQVMDLLMNPQVAYLMFMGSIGLLYFEVTHPGMIAPGVIGGVGLIISLISLHMLDVTWGGLLLILAGIAFMIAEAFTPGFGVLGIGGLAAFLIGSLFLFDPEQSGYILPLTTILPTVILLGSIMLGMAYLALTTRKRRHKSQAALDGIVDNIGVVSEVQPGDGTYGMIDISGETWRATSKKPMHVGDRVKVKGNEGLTLRVEHEV